MIVSTRPRISCSSSPEALGGFSLGKEVQERLVRIGKHLHPAARIEQLDPVGQVDVAAGELLVEDSHHEALLRPRAGELAMDQRRLGQLGDELGERPLDGREQLEQLGETRDGVVGGQKLGEDVAAADGPGEDDSVGCRGARQVGERVRRPHHLERPVHERCRPGSSR